MTDEELIRLYWKRNERAISETSRIYGKYCYAIAYNILHDNEDSEECVNDSYHKVWNAIPPTKPKVFSAFIGRIVRNISLDRYKMRTAEKRGGSQIPVILDEIGEIASDTPSPEDECVRQEVVAAINDFLTCLPMDQRVMLVRRYWYADDVRSIAERLGMRENSVSVALRRIRNRLREYLISRGIEL